MSQFKISEVRAYHVFHCHRFFLINSCCYKSLFLFFSHRHSLFHFPHGPCINNDHAWLFKMVSAYGHILVPCHCVLLYSFLRNQRNALIQLEPHRNFKNIPSSRGMLKETRSLSDYKRDRQSAYYPQPYNAKNFLKSS